jgi:Rrf2 family protein
LLSHTSEYALRATIYLAAREGEGPIKLEQIADELAVPRNYLSKTLHQLARVGVLRSDRGPTGGFRLARDPRSLTLIEIVAPFDPVRLARRCILGKGQCSDETPCAAHDRWKVVAEPMRAFFRGTTVADLIDGTASVPTNATPPATPGEPEDAEPPRSESPGPRGARKRAMPAGTRSQRGRS